MGSLSPSDKKYLFRCLAGIFLAGLAVRAFFAFWTPTAHDVDAWRMFSGYWPEITSPYDATERYRYSPIWFWIITATSFFAEQCGIAFTAAIRLPITLADTAILWVLTLSALKLGLGARKTAWVAGCFFLNPVSFLVTGLLGQFDSISLAFALPAWFAMEFFKKNKFFWSALFLSGSVAVKHFTVMLTPVFAWLQRTAFQKIGFCFLAPALFIGLFVPFLSDWHWIEANVLGYNLHGGYWGWSGVICRSVLFFTGFDIIAQPWFKILDYFNPLLYIGIFLVSFRLVKKYDLLDCIVITLLIFFSFTTQISPQYTVWLIPFAALRPNRYFYAYSVIGGVQLSAFYYAHYHWWHEIDFVGTVPNLVPETFILFRYLTWLTCVLWLAKYAGLTERLKEKFPGLLRLL